MENFISPVRVSPKGPTPSLQKIQQLCKSAQYGSYTSLSELVSLMKRLESEAQVQLCIRTFRSQLHPKFFPPKGPRNTPISAMSIRTPVLAYSALKHLPYYVMKWPSVEEALIDAWPTIFEWLVFFRRQSRLPPLFAAITHGVSIEILTSFTNTEKLSQVVKSSAGVFSMILQTWIAEAGVPAFKLTRYNAAYALFVHSCGFSETDIYARIVIPHGGGESAVARTALKGLRYNVSQSPMNLDHVGMDLQILLTLSKIYVPLQDALVHQGSIVSVCDALRKFLMPGVCNSADSDIPYLCIHYLIASLEASDGVSLIIQALKTDLLASILRSHHIISRLPHVGRHFGEWIVERLLPKYLIYRPITVLVNKSIQTMDSDIEPKTDSTLWKPWAGFKWFAEHRRKDLKMHRAIYGGRCSNSQCPSGGVRNESSSYKKCSGCNWIFFCSDSCQRQEWPRHKVICRITNEYVNGPDNHSPVISMASFHFVNSIALNTVNFAEREIIEAIRRESIPNAGVILDFSQIPVLIRISSSTQVNIKSVADYHLAIKDHENVFVVHIELPAGMGKKGWSQTRDLDIYSEEEALSRPSGTHCEPYIVEVANSGR